ncbi:MAG TPA: hypothetical protein VF815_44605 [Myxococcaceae bacterium]|jgi:hypothetical protein
MTKVLLIALASVGFNTAELPEETETSAAACTATVSGPTFGFSGRMYFHYKTTCTAPVELITLKASVTGPYTLATSLKTCSFTDTCSTMIAVTYKRGTWTWVNDTTYPAGVSMASRSVTLSQ